MRARRSAPSALVPGGPEALSVQSREVPAPGPGEVRIRTAAATVNPTDVGTRTLGPGYGAPDQVPPPWVPGMEVAGVVEAVGGGAAWPVGQRVRAIVLPNRPLGGARAELVVVPADALAAIPDGVTDAETATLPVDGLTVAQALDLLALAPGAVLGVVGAAGEVGGYAVQLDKQAGLPVVADAKPADEELVRGFGADVLGARSADVAGSFRAAVFEGVDGMIGAAVLDAAVPRAVRDGGPGPRGPAWLSGRAGGPGPARTPAAGRRCAGPPRRSRCR